MVKDGKSKRLHYSRKRNVPRTNETNYKNTSDDNLDSILALQQLGFDTSPTFEIDYQRQNDKHQDLRRYRGIAANNNHNNPYMLHPDIRNKFQSIMTD